MLETAAPPDGTPGEKFDFLATAEDDTQTVTAISGVAQPFALLLEERHGVDQEDGVSQVGDQPGSILNPTMSGPFLQFTADFTATKSTFFGLDVDEDIEFD